MSGSRPRMMLLSWLPSAAAAVPEAAVPETSSEGTVARRRTEEEEEEEALGNNEGTANDVGENERAKKGVVVAPKKV